MYFYESMRIIWLIIVLTLVACKNIEVRKYSEEEVFKEEVNHIDWKNVDSYPSFEGCEDNVSKEKRKDCFISKLVEHVLESMSEHKMIIDDSIREKVILTLEITATGEPRIKEMELSKELEEKIEPIRKWLTKAIEDLPQIYPAEKRGIPVSSTFKFPLLIEAN